MSTSVVLGKWAQCRPLFASRDRPRIAGISGGATSGLMAALCDKRTVLSFQNTGKEHPRTLEFLDELADSLGRPIVWLEYRPPATKGAPPCEMQFALVNSKTCARHGEPFEMLLEAIAAYRSTKGKGPIAPWWRSRICTTYLKTRLARRYIASVLGWTEWDELVGLRADEPDRVARLRVGQPNYIGRVAPLNDAGITLPDVTAWWQEQAFHLGLLPHLGNCTGCFLKDQADLSRSLDECGDTDWWCHMADRYPMFGGRDFVGYRQLAAEAPLRRTIETALRANETPWRYYAGQVSAKRFGLVVIQERKRITGKTEPFACSCEGADILANMDDEQENTYIESLPTDAQMEIPWPDRGTLA